MAIQKAVKDAVRNMADVELNAVNIHVAGIAPDKTPKPALTDLFDETSSMTSPLLESRRELRKMCLPSTDES